MNVRLINLLIETGLENMLKFMYKGLKKCTARLKRLNYSKCIFALQFLQGFFHPKITQF